MRKLVLLAAVFLVSTTFTYAQLTFTSIDYSKGFGTRVRGINNHGQMVGSYVDKNGNSHALLIRNGKFIPLAPKTILGTEWSDAYKINDRGEVVGEVCDDVACHGFLLHQGVVTTLDFPGASDTYAFGINNSGTIVGTWDVYDADGNFLYEQGFTWKDGNFTELTYPGSADSFPIGGNNVFGIVVGGWDSDPNAISEHGYASWMGQFISFDAPFQDVALTQADGINDLGFIVGQEFTVYEYENNVGHGFLAIGTYFTPLDYPGAVMTTAWGINSAGLMVGNWYDSNFGAHGWLAQLGGEGKQYSTPGQGSVKVPTVRAIPAPGRKLPVPARMERMSR